MKQETRLCRECLMRKEVDSNGMAYCLVHHHEIYAKSVACTFFDDVEPF